MHSAGGRWRPWSGGRRAAYWLVVITIAGCARGAPHSPHQILARPHARFDEPSFADTGSRAILAAALNYPARTAQPVPPVSLTATDGTGLSLTVFEARAVIEGPLAFTELRMTFENPGDRVLEGRFAVALPAGAAISRLAMRGERGWHEAEVVERQLARQVYEDFLHQKQDPALLEKEAGNEYRARVFPIAPRGTKEIIVSYSHELAAAHARYRLPLKGLPRIERLRVTALVAADARSGSYRRVESDQRDVVPKADFEVPGVASAAGLESGELVVLRVKPSFAAQAERIDAITVLFDTSASRAIGFAEAVARLGRLIEQLKTLHGPELRLVVATFDHSVTPVFDGRVRDFGAGQLEAVLARRPLGASNLEKALEWLGREGASRRAVIVGDMIPTAGQTEPAALGAVAARLSTSVDRLDVLLAGGIHDPELARRLAHENLSQAGAVLDAELSEHELAQRLSLPTRSKILLGVRGARWTWPEKLDGVQPGDEILVYAVLGGTPKLRPRSAVVTLQGPLQQTLELPLRAAPRPLLERALAGAEIARLTAQRDRLGVHNGVESQRVREAIVSASSRHRVLSDFTALLVLETEEDYARYRIDRRALVDILSVGETGIEVQRGRELVVAASHSQHSKKAKGLSPSVRSDAVRRPTQSASRERAAPPAPAEKPKPSINRAADGRADQAYGYEFADDPTPASAPAQPAAVEQNDSTSLRRWPAAPPAPATGVDAMQPAQQPPMVPAPLAEPGSLGRSSALREGPPALSGPFAEVARLIRARDSERAVVTALKWRIRAPDDVMALVALGEALEAHGNLVLAARAYGSIIDLFPARADLRRFAGERLDRLERWAGGLAADAYAKALEQRPDHLSGYRLLAFALVRQNRFDRAFDTLERGLGRAFPPDRFAGGKDLLREDLGLVAAAWLRRDPVRRAEVERRLGAASAALATVPSLRFVLYWETDANDVDFHVEDGRGNHAFYGEPWLASGGQLLADVTTGYGPELFAIPGKPSAFPYRLGIHYYSRGPMGYGMGKVEVIEHDGQGRLRFADLPFVVMNDGAYIDLGAIPGPLFSREQPNRLR
jgi:tetratricopeptide (TPR) repeat protein